MGRCRCLANLVALSAVIVVTGCGEDGEEALPLPPDFDASETESGVEADADADEEPSCLLTTCTREGAECGTIPDGCGGTLSCGDCPAGTRCGGGGPNVCGTEPCQPKSCVQKGASCGIVSDGCSEAIDCGGCPAPQSCGGGGTPYQCGCAPKTCTTLGASCGTAPDGCGDVVDCGTCPGGQTCGGAGANRCGNDSCEPKTCAQLSASCGYVSDRCSRAIDCGTCQPPQICGGQGLANQCGCLPKTCAQLAASCGDVESGCGYVIDCGDCPPGVVCGGAGVPNQCACTCTLPHAQTTCLDAACAIASCDTGWGDCDDEDSNGCETDLGADASHCGSCGVSCDDGNACTVGDACQSGTCAPGAATTCGTPPNTACYEAIGDCDPASGACQYQTKPDSTSCGTTTRGGWSACSWNGECSNSGSQSRSCTDYRCSSGTCNTVPRTEDQACTRTVANGTGCSAGYCCSNSCVARNNKSHCGSCGVDCGTQSCVKISGLSQYSCTRASNAFCQGAGFGSIATCYSTGGQMLCNCQCPSGTSCTGQCGGGGTCADVSGHNYCHY